MDPLSITAAVVGITAPTVHCIRLLSEDIQKIVDAPETLKSLRNDLLSVDQALASLQAVSDAQWKSLGQTVVSQSETATTSCKESCDRFRTDLIAGPGTARMGNSLCEIAQWLASSNKTM
jgi:hypothetical protein